MIAFLLTAGEGRRLRPLTEKYIKPSLPLLNLPLCYYSLYLVKKMDCNNILLNKHHLPEQVDKLAQVLNKQNHHVQVSDESSQLLGSGGALWKARPILEKHDYFLVANGDEVLIPTEDSILKQLLEKHIEKQSIATLLTCDHPELLKSLKPVWTNKQGQVVGFGLQSPNPEAQPVHYTGYKVFSRKIFDYIPSGESNIFYDVVTKALKNGETVETLHLDSCFWQETGNPPSFIETAKMLAEEHLKEVNVRLNAFALPLNHLFKHPNGILISPKEVSRTDIDFKNFVCIGNDIEFGENISLENVIINSHVTLPDNTFLKNNIIMEL